MDNNKNFKKLNVEQICSIRAFFKVQYTFYRFQEEKNINLFFWKKNIQKEGFIYGDYPFSNSKKPMSKEEVEYIKTEFPKAVEEKLFRPRASKPVALRIKKEDLKKLDQ